MATPFSFRPPPSGNRGPKNLSEFIARVSSQPGGFRSITAESLREQAEQEKNVAEEEDTEMKNGSDEEDQASAIDIIAARNEILMNIELAQRETGTLLEFVSLLLTKDNPNLASQTLSQHLRSMAGIGTLGATALPTPNNVVQERVPENKLVAVGQKLKDINHTADKTLAAATRLQEEIKAETKYWAEVLAVSESGWPTFDHPQVPHTMAVRFGFTTTAPEFTALSTSIMKRGDDGAVILDCGKDCASSKRLQVSIWEGDKILGASHLPGPLPDDAPLEDRVKEARDTILAVELWHELNREGRTLVGHGVRMESSRITYRIDAGQLLVLELVELTDARAAAAVATPNQLAQLVYNALHILLQFAHRQNATRTEKTGSGTKKGSTSAYNLLYPIVTYLQHEQALQEVVRFLSDTVAVLRAAGLPEASFSMTEAPIVLRPGIPTAEAIVLATLHPAEVHFHLSLTPESPVSIIAQANAVLGTRFLVNLLPPANTDQGNAGAQASSIDDNPLSQWYPPIAFPPAGSLQPPSAPGPRDAFYPTSKALIQYLAAAVPRALAARLYEFFTAGHPKLPTPPPTVDAQGETADPPPTGWYISYDAVAVRCADKGDVAAAQDDFGIHFAFPLVSENGVASETVGRPELHVQAFLAENGQAVQKMCTYSAAGASTPEKIWKVAELIAAVTGAPP